jgi:hypothetical protein
MNRKYMTPAIILFLMLGMGCGYTASFPASPTFIPPTGTPAQTSTPVPTSTPAPTNTLSVFPTVSPGQLKNEVYLGGGAGGGGGDLCENPQHLPSAGTTLPTLKFLQGEVLSTSLPGLMAMCVYGIPQDGIVNLALFDPNDQSVSQANIKFVQHGDYAKIVHVPDGAVDYGTMGFAFITEGISVLHLDFWKPVGLLAGDWKIVFSYGAERYESKLKVTEGRGIGIVPEYLDPLDANRLCAPLYGIKNNPFKIGETAIIYGRGFSAGADVPIGFYHDTGRRNDISYKIFELSHSLMAKADDQGNFKAWVVFDDSYEPGVYLYSANNLDSDFPQSCFYIP